MKPRAPLKCYRIADCSLDALRSEQSANQCMTARKVLAGTPGCGYETARFRSSYLAASIVNDPHGFGLPWHVLAGILDGSNLCGGKSPTGPTPVRHADPRKPLKIKGSPTCRKGPTLPRVRARDSLHLLLHKNASRVYKTCPTCLTFRTSIIKQILTRSDMKKTCPTCRTA